MRDEISIQDAQNILEVLDDCFGNTATLADAILDRLDLKGESQRKIRAKRTMQSIVSHT